MGITPEMVEEYVEALATGLGISKEQAKLMAARDIEDDWARKYRR